MDLKSTSSMSSVKDIHACVTVTRPHSSLLFLSSYFPSSLLFPSYSSLSPAFGLEIPLRIINREAKPYGKAEPEVQ